MSEMIKINLSVNSPVYIQDIAASVGININELRYQLERTLQEHYFHFGSKPFFIEYDPVKGYMLRAGSAIGRLQAGSIVLEIIPKLPMLSIGKCLGMAQCSNTNLLKINNGILLKDYISENEKYSSLDFLSFSFLDSLLTIKKNGLARKFEEIFGPATKLRGTISFQETITAGKCLHEPITGEIEPTYDILPNQILKYALNICLSKAQAREIRDLANTISDFFAGVKLLDDSSMKMDLLSYNFGLPRPDYERALSYAKAIIEGRYISEGDQEELIPSFTLDLDKVFESYCSYHFDKLISKTSSDTLLQHPFPHDMRPLVTEKKIYPDIVLRNRKNKKSVILDVKNKYSSLRDDGCFTISNEDIYQVSYYAKTLGSRYCILVYPGINPKIQYPLKTSESDAVYSLRRSKVLVNLKSKSAVKIFSKDEIYIIIYVIDLAGNLKNTKRSIASLCQFSVDLISEKIKW
jgi:hypothetical protein